MRNLLHEIDSLLYGPNISGIHRVSFAESLAYSSFGVTSYQVYEFRTKDLQEEVRREPDSASCTPPGYFRHYTRHFEMEQG